MLITILAVAALILGIIAVVESRGRNWAAWGVICLAVIHLAPALG